MERRNMTGIELIAQERQRQIDDRGLTEKFLNNFQDDELLIAASCYLKGYKNLTFAGHVNGNVPIMWPEGMPKSFWQNNLERISELAKAGALIAAEIDRLQAIEGKEND